MLFYKMLHYGQLCARRGRKLRCKLIRRTLRILYGCNIGLYADIDQSVRFSHYALGVTINDAAKIGGGHKLR